MARRLSYAGLGPPTASSVNKMGGVKATASDPASNPSNVHLPAETANVPCRPEQPGNKSLNRPLILKRRKLRLNLPPTIVRRRSTAQIKKTPDSRPEESKPKSNLYPLPAQTRSTPTSSVAPDEIETKVAPGREVPALSANPGSRPNSLQMRGDYWEMCYENRSAIVDDSRGLRYIALLIQHSGENKGPLHATELVALAKGAGNVLVELPSKDPVIDAIAENQITKRLEQIAFERNDASARDDYDRVALLDAEVEEITLEFERLKGRGRKKATFNNDGEKARKAVSKAIADTVAKLGGLADMEPLAKHLAEAIRKGQWLSYNGNIEWKIDPLPRQNTAG
jgi:hypothetical protein